MLVIDPSKKFTLFSFFSFLALSACCMLQSYFASDIKLHSSFQILITCSTITSAIIFTVWAKEFLNSKLSPRIIILIFFALSLLIFYKTSLYFFWDEWHLIDRFRNDGITAIFTSHNEHFIPLAFLFYFIQLKLFAANYGFYLLLSSLIHALNSYLLLAILRKLSVNFASSEALSRALSLVFLVSALHTEALGWAFEQCLLLAASFLLGSILFALEYFDKQNNRALIGSAVCAMLAPFFFGNGFIVILLLACISLQRLLVWGKLYFKESSQILLCSALALAIPAALYLLFVNKGAGHNLEHASMLGDPKQALKYLLVGTQLGTVVRGLGLYPGLSYGDAREFFEAGQQFPLLHPIREFRDPENIYLYLGIVISLVSLIFTLKAQTKNYQSLSLWFCGQAWLIAAFALPALGRWQFGYPQSLSLRYQYFALPGLLISLIPVFHLLIQSSKLAGWRNTLYLGAMLHFSVQFLLSGNFDYFSYRGEENRIFLKQLDSSEELPKGNVPLTLTPEKTYKEISSCSKWLRENSLF